MDVRSRLESGLPIGGSIFALMFISNVASEGREDRQCRHRRKMLKEWGGERIGRKTSVLLLGLSRLV